MKDPIKNASKGSDAFSVKKVDQRSAFIIMDGNEKEPREAEKEEKTIEHEEEVQRRPFLLPLDIIEPKGLGENQKWDGTVTRMEENAEKQCRGDQEPQRRCLEVFHKKIEARQPEKHE